MAAAVFMPILVATLGPLQFGFHLSELNAIENEVTCSQLETGSQPNCIAFDVESWALAQAIYTIGGFLGALLLGGRLIESRGFREALVYTACILLLGPVTEAAAIDPATMAIGRCITGIGAGAATVVSPVFIAKIAPKNRRGFFGTLTQVMITLGIFAGLAVGMFFSAHHRWRLALAVAACPAVIMLITITSFPTHFEVPTSNEQRTVTDLETQPLLGKRPLAGDVQKSSGSVAVTTTPAIAASLTSAHHIVSDVSGNTSATGTLSMWDVLRDPVHRSAAIAAITAMMAQQLTGINSVTMYSVSILKQSTSADAGMISLLVAAINVVAIAVFAPLPDMIGRKPCLVISATTMGMSSVALALGLSYDLRALSVGGMLSFVCSFSLGLGSVPYLISTELPDSQGVAATSSLALAGSWFSSFLVAQTFPLLNTVLAHGQVYWVFAGIALAFSGFALWYIPETKGSSR